MILPEWDSNRRCEVLAVGPSGTLAAGFVRVKVFDIASANGEWWPLVLRVSELAEFYE